jgi:hypothetical protein
MTDEQPDSASKTGLDPHTEEYIFASANEPIRYLRDFGIRHLNIKAAAELVAIDLWFSGEIEGVEEPADFEGDPRDPRLIASLTGVIVQFERRLSAAVDCARLKPAVVRRDFDEKLIPTQTNVEYEDLCEWLEARGHECGDIMTEWADAEDEIWGQLCDEVSYLRALAKRDKHAIRGQRIKEMLARMGKLGEEDTTAMLAALRATITENEWLKQRLDLASQSTPAKVDRPLSTRARRTLLTIIAALCNQVIVDSSARGAAQRIKEMTELLGAPVDDGTIGKALSEIPDALEARKT